MSLRPRYSLLTLLVLTALVAGGVKLWYGPHHVVDKTENPDREVEYTYTNSWNGKRIIQGPMIERQYDKAQLKWFSIYWYREGIRSDWDYTCAIVPIFQDVDPLFFQDPPENEFTPEELARLHVIAKQEKQRQSLEADFHFLESYNFRHLNER